MTLDKTLVKERLPVLPSEEALVGLPKIPEIPDIPEIPEIPEVPEVPGGGLIPVLPGTTPTVALDDDDLKFTVTEGEGFSTGLSGSNPFSAEFTMTARFVTDGGTADSDDFTANDVTLTTSDQFPGITVNFLANDDGIAEGTETMFLEYTLIGAVFESEGRTLKNGDSNTTRRIEIEIIDEDGGVNPNVNVINGTRGKDNLKGTGKADDISGLGGKDKINARGGDDTVTGGGGKDNIKGGGGKDTLYGDGGNDKIKGGGGNDNMFGGSGKDTLDGGGGKDRYTGGAGADTFIIKGSPKGEVIGDYEAGVDTIRLVKTGASKFEDLSLIQSGDTVVVGIGNDTALLLVDTELADVNGADFDFA